jgi:hypothetical protein
MATNSYWVDQLEAVWKAYQTNDAGLTELGHVMRLHADKLFPALRNGPVGPCRCICGVTFPPGVTEQSRCMKAAPTATQLPTEKP